MSKYFRPWNIDQTLLLPPNVQDFLPKGHVSRFIVELVRESLDLKEITGSYVSGLGQPPFDPRRWCSVAYAVKKVIKDERLDVDPHKGLKILNSHFADMAKLRLRSYTPGSSNRDSDLPVVVYFRGGVWVVADLNTYDATPSALAQKADAIVLPVQLLKNADLAMYSAKAAGRRTYSFFEPGMDARMKARHLLETDLRQAIIGGRFEVFYQPIVDLESNQVSGCEALLRWRHPERGIISPAEFIPVAEETGLINQLGDWVLTTACVEAATWPDNVKLAVNVSPVQFRSDTLALKVVAALAASGLSAGRLELEVTEAVLIRDDDAALAMLHQFRALGVRIALDDFGTGYSSLSYLQRFPFDKIKIDRCFIKDIAESGGAHCIVQAVVNIATTCHITTTAEGVETEQQRDLLRTLGYTEMQGYLFSPAKPAADIRRLSLLNHDRAAA